MTNTDNTSLPTVTTQKATYLRHLKKSFLFIFFVSSACHASLYPPELLPLGSDIYSSKKSLSEQCQQFEVTTLARTFKVAKQSQIQLSCVDFSYLGKGRKLKLIFSDNKLDMVQILNIRNVLPDLKDKLNAEYGKPTISSRWLDYFDKEGISLHVLEDKITFVSPRLKKQHGETLSSTKDNHLNLDLTKRQWQQDLDALDKYIRNRHINPFYHNDEQGYLKLFYQAHDYISNTNIPDTNIINSYIEKLVAYTGDGHSFVVGRSKRYGEYPYFVNWFDGAMYITHIGENNRHLLGARVIAFDSHNIAETVNLIRPFSPSVNESSFKRESIYLYKHPGLLFAAGISHSPEQVELKLVLANGKVVSKTFTNNNITNNQINWVGLQEADGVAVPLYRQKNEKQQWFKYLPISNSLYLHYGIVVEQEKGDIHRLSQALIEAFDNHKAEKLIVDIRNNPGGNSYLNGALINAISQHQEINQRGNLFVLTNRNTFSAAINFAGNMEMRTKALFIGEKVGDTTSFPGESGPQASFRLPNSSIVVNLSFSEWNATFEYDQRNAVAVDIPVAFTITDFISGQDQVLKAALEYKVTPIETINLTTNQLNSWLGRYDYSQDKALKIYQQRADKNGDQRLGIF
jgi:hypothetical protein